MLIQHPKIQKLIQETFFYTDELIQDMVVDYQSSVLDIIVNEVLLYIEKNNLQQKLAAIYQKLNIVKLAKTDKINSHKDLYTEIFSTITQYPEITKVIDLKVQEFDTITNQELISAFDTKGKNKILDIIEEDLDAIKSKEDFIKQILTNQAN